MDDLQDEFEDRLIEVISVYNIKGIPVHEQISILSYL